MPNTWFYTPIIDYILKDSEIKRAKWLYLGFKLSIEIYQLRPLISNEHK